MPSVTLIDPKWFTEEGWEDDDFSNLPKEEDRPPTLFAEDPIEKILNIFCPTGPGGGVDASCSPGQVGSEAVRGVLSGSKGVERKDMPQLRKKDQSKMVDWMEKHGVKVTSDYIRTADLKPIQKEYDPKKVEEKPLEALEKPIIISKGGRILDGTHHWLKAQEVDKKYLPVIKLHVGWKKAMELMHKFPKTFKADLLANAMYQSNGQEFWVFPNEFTLNVFCPTGPGGGIDATCSPGESAASTSEGMGEPKIIKGQAWLPFVDPDDVNQWQLNARATKAIETVQKEFDENILDERFKEYEDWDSVPEDDKDQARIDYIDENYQDVKDRLIDEARDNASESMREALEEDNDLAQSVWDDFVEKNDLPREFMNADMVEIENIRGEFTMTHYIDDEELAAKVEAIERDSISQLKTELGERINSQLEDYAQDWEPDDPDSLNNQAIEEVSDAWDNMSDRQKLDYAGFNDYVKIEEPENYEPYEGDSDYAKTQLIARELQANLTVKELEDRGLKMDSSFDPKHLAQQMWGGDGWVGSSTTPNGLLIQHAAALELGGHKQEWDQERQEKIDKAARMLLRGMADKSQYVGTTEDEKTKMGIEIAKAHVAATWATTQFILDKAGEKTVSLYRGLQLEGMDKVEQKEVEVHPARTPFTVGSPAHQFSEKKIQLTGLQLKRNGAASTAFGEEGLRVANNWQGIGKIPDNARRVVLRIQSPKESVLSLPCFGKNIEHEREVVISGNKYKWDAWLDKAPSFEVHPHVK